MKNKFFNNFNVFFYLKYAHIFELGAKCPLISKRYKYISTLVSTRPLKSNNHLNECWDILDLLKSRSWVCNIPPSSLLGGILGYLGLLFLHRYKAPTKYTREVVLKCLLFLPYFLVGQLIRTLKSTLDNLKMKQVSYQSYH
jgi:hypothetical protein